MSGVLGADIGGTFTDIIYSYGDGRIGIRKRLSTSEDYSRGISLALEDLLEEAGSFPGPMAEVRHGTTIGTNAVLERSGANAVLVVTKGFRDRLEIGRLRIPRLYDIAWEKPQPLIPRNRRLELDERVSSQGEILVEPTKEEIDKLVDRIVALKADSVAISFLNSYLNDANEVLVFYAIQERLPEISITRSSELLSEIGEYERMSTASVNAYVTPTMEKYLARLEKEINRVAPAQKFYLMQSNGGVIGLQEAVRKAVFAIESGPAAGVIAARELGNLLGEPNLVSFDMGGTTAKASLIEGGEITYSAEFEVGGEISRISRLIKGGGYLIRAPTIDIAEVGAGGGSIAWIDAAGQLRLGPKSAGSNPGPACYGRGGTAATVSDASLVLGFINPAGLAGGTVELNAQRAEEALLENVGRHFGWDHLRTAAGIHELANAAMGQAIRAVSTERGRDIRDFVLVAFGGNGPIHAAAIARTFGIRRILIPPRPGLFSVVGLIGADVEEHFVFTPRENVSLETHELIRVFEAFEGDYDVARAMSDMPSYNMVKEWFLDLRYQRQGQCLRIPFSKESAHPRYLSEQFEQEHKAQFGFCNDGAPVEVVAVRIVIKHSNIYLHEQVRNLLRHGGPTQETVESMRLAYFGKEFGMMETPVLLNGRRALERRPYEGPLIIDEYDSSIVVPPGYRATSDNNVVILEEEN